MEEVLQISETFRSDLQKELGKRCEDLEKDVKSLSDELKRVGQGVTEIHASTTSQRIKRESLEHLLSYSTLDEFKESLRRTNKDKMFCPECEHEPVLLLKFLIALTSVMDDEHALEWMLVTLLNLRVNDPETSIMTPKILNYIINELEKTDSGISSKGKGLRCTIFHTSRSLLLNYSS